MALMAQWKKATFVLVRLSLGFSGSDWNCWQRNFSGSTVPFRTLMRYAELSYGFALLSGTEYQYSMQLYRLVIIYFGWFFNTNRRTFLIWVLIRFDSPGIYFLFNHTLQSRKKKCKNIRCEYNSMNPSLYTNAVFSSISKW